MPATIFGFDPDLDPERLIGANFALAAEHQEVLRQRLSRDLDEIGSPWCGCGCLLPPRGAATGELRVRG